ncbi:hypothetical protein [Lactiplantibacillus pentosus]|uniref:hypothetical protein n=1 Tax=Lactiplantibacillus pentosus TaxID=1589 RepID=UPI000B5467E6|nr:hypothetical protein [Lactiplantibacillus pentosus]ASG80283.1 hypothetical protein CEW82_10650 [Lactiplantibacillus pentosus]MDO7805613.1 hypothetical protein [Lactiplantibacillus pentosus]
MEKFTNDKLTKYGNAEKVQQYQEDQLQSRLNELHQSLSELEKLQVNNADSLDALLSQATTLTQKIDSSNITNEDVATIEQQINLTAQEQLQITQNIQSWAPLPTMALSNNWDQFETNLNQFALSRQIDLSTDPLYDLLSVDERKQIKANIQADFGYKKAHCDKYDYTLSVLSGTFSGLIDVFFVGSGIDGKKSAQKDERGVLSKKSDDWFKKIVNQYAQFDYQLRKNSGKYEKGFPKHSPKNIGAAVQYLEMQYKVPYDAQYGKRLNGVLPKDFKMTASNHHLFSLAHYPDLVGLIFSILNQFTDSGTYLANGHFITTSMQNDHFELKGHNLVAKLFCGFVNWLGHIMSDAVGSSGAVKKGNRGSGLPIPGTEIFQLLNFRILKTDNLSVSKLCTKVFENGYDARHAAVTTIPVLINELLTRLLWALKQYFYHKRPLLEILKAHNAPELNRMLLCSYGAFAGLDIGDAVAHGIKKSHGNYYVALLEGLSRLNISLYPRLALMCYKETFSWYNNQHYNSEEFDNYLGQEWEQLTMN